MPKGHSKNPIITSQKIREKQLGFNNSFYGKKHTPESLEKIRQASLGNKHMLGKKPSLETRFKMSKSHIGLNTWSKGKKHTDETKKKISIATKGKIVSLETRKKMSIAFTGRKMSQSMKDKISKIHTGRKHTEEQNKRHSEYQKIHPPSKETIEKLILYNKKRIGDKHHGWKGGISKDKNHLNKIYAESHRKRKNIKLEIGGWHTSEEFEKLKKEYGYMCPSCKKLEPLIKLTRDHITPIKEKGSDSIENIQPLCQSCNSIKHCKIIKYENTFRKIT